MHVRTLAPAILLAAVASADAQTFRAAPLLGDRGPDVLDRAVARETVDRELFGSPWATVVIGHVDVYERFPYLESRWFQIVSDPAWNRLLLGELDGRLAAHDGSADALGALDGPRGLSSDERDRVWVADTGNHRIVAYDVHTEFDDIRLVPAYSIEGLHRPFDVAYSDGGTPWNASDDRLYVADTGANRVAAYALDGAAPRLVAEIGELGDGAGRFAGPTAITVGRRDGVHTADVYVADAHSGRLVRLEDRGDVLAWGGSAAIDGGLVTSLDTDAWGSVYAASPQAGRVTKLTADLEPVATLSDGLVRPRAFHVPFATRVDHRDGSRVHGGRGAGMVVEQWGEASGLRLVKLGVEVRDLAVEAGRDLALDFLLTDRADVTGEIVDADGRVAARFDLGARDAGRQSVAVAAADLDAPVPGGDWTLRVVSRSVYDDAPEARAETRFDWAGSGAAGLPTSVGIVGSTPNPFRASTRVEFAIPAGRDRAWTLSVHDVTGRRVASLGSGVAQPGVHSVAWDGRDSAGRAVAAGVYLYRLEVDGEISTRKAVHLR